MDIFLNHISDRRLILASQSPRRQHLLQELGIPFEILVKEGIEENYPAELQESKIPMFLSELKSSAYNEEIAMGGIVITADTIVWLDGKVLGKPIDREDAISMLTQLSGNRHTVYTGVCIRSKSNQIVFSSRTDVFFKQLSMAEIEFYVDEYHPYDKAGAYGVQEWIGYAAVERIEGSYFNVMGLPIHQLYEELRMNNW
jgi:septum formation protein